MAVLAQSVKWAGPGKLQRMASGALPGNGQESQSTKASGFGIVSVFNVIGLTAPGRPMFPRGECGADWRPEAPTGGQEMIMARSSGHSEHHVVERLGWLRAAVFGGQ